MVYSFENELSIKSTISTDSKLSALCLQVQHHADKFNTLVQKCKHVDALNICYNSDQGY